MFVPMPVYSDSRPERRGVSRRTVIEAAKEITVPELAERLAAEQGKILRPSGRQLVVRCLMPDHLDQTPSFFVDPEKNVFFCHGCLRGGDVVELARYVWGYPKGEAAMAAADLLREFGHEVPARPPSWFRKQQRQRPVRDAIGKARFNRVRERLYTRLLRPMAAGIEDDGDRGYAEQALWESTDHLARLVLSGSMGGRDG